DDDTGPTSTVPGFLFDMNRFFQRLVSRFLHEHLPGHEVREEQALFSLMRYAPSENPRHRPSPRPRPDFEVRPASGPSVLLDAKYRDLWEHSLPREMLYQLSLYALSQPPGGWATILYPGASPVARRARIELRDTSRGWDRASVMLQPIHLDELATLVADETNRNAKQACGALARAWLLGPGTG
ncbi:MAG: hypothetical protein EOO70_08700, partial [Myxococcaceae bacterium]